MTQEKKLLAVDFFCCAGGVTCGFRKAGIEVLGGVDIESEYKESYEINNIGSKFIQADIAQLQPKDLEDKLGIRPNMDNLIFIGCSPCQYYTIIQTDKTKSAKTKLLLEDFQRFVEYFRPAYIFIENVPGLKAKSETPVEGFKAFLKQAGYVMDDNVINAADYNVPQNRNRYVLIASRINDDISIPLGNKTHITVKEALKDFKPISAGHRDNDSDLKHWTSRMEEINIRRIKKVAPDGGTRLAWKDDPELQLPCYIGKDSTFPDVYGRMYWNIPAPTITTKFHSISNGRFGHPEQHRAISLREGATLQSFPKSYKFISDSALVVSRMIGNAVPPEMAKAIGDSLIKAYASAAIQSEG